MFAFVFKFVFPSLVMFSISQYVAMVIASWNSLVFLLTISLWFSESGKSIAFLIWDRNFSGFQVIDKFL